MSVTTPNETIIEKSFDKFYDTLKHKDLEVSLEVQELLSYLEENLIEDLRSYLSYKEWEDAVCTQ